MPILQFSLLRVFSFVFFSGVYAFLSFWIATSIFLFFPFALFAIVFFPIIAAMQFGFNKALSEQSVACPSSLIVVLVLVIFTVFSALYFAGVWYMQKWVITEIGVPRVAYMATDWLLSIAGIALSFYFSFNVRRGLKEGKTEKAK